MGTLAVSQSQQQVGGDGLESTLGGHGDAEGAAAKKAKKNDKTRCYRCDEPGHHGRDCTVQVCDICESKEHASEVCPLLSAPKPQVLMHGFINEVLMFFEQPTTESYKPKIDNVRLAMLAITGGSSRSRRW